MTANMDTPFQRNAWYAVAEAAEATRAPLRRLALNEPLAIFRTQAGAAVVLEDRCRHRLAPLSAGRLIGDTIECPYHGLRYDAAGRCTHVPGQSDIPARARVKSYAVIERYGLVWAWMNDREDADPAKMPDWRWAEDDDWASIQGRFHINCNYMLSVDNLMDLSHVGYVHRTTIGSSRDAEHARVDTFAERSRVTVRRWVQRQKPPPSFRKKLGSDAPVDRWQLIEFQPPCYVRTFKGMGKDICGTPEYVFDSVDTDPPRTALVVSRGNTCITPETGRSCHYFTVHCHYRENDSANLEFIWGQTVETLNQDVDILERTQENIDLDPAARMVFIDVDKGVGRARLLARLTAKAEAGD